MTPRRSSDANRLRLAICAIAKNEAINILEWIAYHRVLGVEKFFIYDNGSVDDTKSVLDPLIAMGLVDLTDWPVKPGQIEAYDDFARRHRNDVDWAAFIDLDEFINPFGYASILGWLSTVDAHAAVAIQWTTFGPSGHEVPPPGLLIEAYLTKLPCDHAINGHVKMLVRMKDYVRCTGPHTFEVTGSIVDEYGAALVAGAEHGFAIQPVIAHNGVMLNHYYTRSRQEWLDKVARGEADSSADTAPRRQVEWFHYYELHADVPEERILKFAPATRAMLATFERGSADG